MIPQGFGVMWAALARTRSKRPRKLAVVAGVAVFSLLRVFPILAQSCPPAAGPLPSFEVASVKRNRSGENTAFHILPNRLTVRNYLIQMLIEFAYGHDLGEIGRAHV